MHDLDVDVDVDAESQDAGVQEPRTIRPTALVCQPMPGTEPEA